MTHSDMTTCSNLPASSRARFRAVLPRILFGTALGLGTILAGGNLVIQAQAATATGTIAVSATVLAACTMTTAPLAFGNYSSSGGNVTAQTDISVE
jgi:spore coat protein U-like protein